MLFHRGRSQAARPSRSLAVLILLLLVTTSSLVGCSRRLSPTSPAADGSAIDRATRPASNGRKERVVVTLVSDQDGPPLAAAYGATLVANGWRVAGLKPALGQSADDLVTVVSRDPRVLTAEKDTPVECAEARQKSWAFDDGWGSAEACEDQPATYSCNLSPALQVSRGAGVLVAMLDTGGELTH